MKTKLLLLFGVVLSLRLTAAEDTLQAAQTAFANGQLDLVEALLAPLAEAPAADARVFVCLSQVRVRQGRAKEAVALAEKAVAAAPNDPRCHSNLGQVLSVRIGEVNFLHQGLLAPRMRGAFEKAIALDPERLDGYVGLARYYTHAPAIAGGGREPAERYAREIEKRNPQFGTLELARIAERFADPATALTLYTKAATVQPNDGAIQESLGRIHEALGDQQDARVHYERALALDPNRVGARNALARMAGAKS